MEDFRAYFEQREREHRIAKLGNKIRGCVTGCLSWTLAILLMGVILSLLMFL